MTTVISVRGRNRRDLEADPSFVYVGRRCRGWPGSIWGNPFGRVMPRAKTDFQAALFSGWLREQGLAMAILATAPKSSGITEASASEARRLILERLPELRGKTLGCWCGDWRPGEPEIPCHAVVLANLANAIEDVVGDRECRIVVGARSQG